MSRLDSARRALPEHAHRYSPKKFTQHQLFACLVLKNFLRTDYRGLAAYLEDHPALLAILELKQVPHFTTFQKAAHRGQFQMRVAIDQARNNHGLVKIANSRLRKLRGQSHPAANRDDPLVVNSDGAVGN